MRLCRDTQNTVIKEGFRICGLTFLITQRGGFIFDRPHLESLRECSSRISAYREFLSVYHVIGGSIDLCTKVSVAAKALEKHMAASIAPRFPGGNSLVACAMKHCRTAFLNQMSPDANWFDTGAATRDQMLQEEYEEKRDGPHDWLQIYKSLDVPAMVTLDMANIYYALPAPDACPYKLITTVEKNMSKENPVNPLVRREFEDFVKTVSVARACFRSGDKPKVWIDPEFTEQVNLFMESARTKGTIVAPKEIWGKVELRGHYPFLPRADMEHLNPGDVTCIVPGVNRFSAPLPTGLDSVMAGN
jgi:hypothetical protein